ncbi:MAG: VOC family protein [Paracoccus sp. (in: a-proteobacteria)]
MFDHIGFPVSDLAASRAFYEAALAPLGITLRYEVSNEMTGGHGAHLGFGREGGYSAFWIGDGKPALGGGCHIAFTASDQATVDAFYRAALAAGGIDNGAPGLRPQYHAGYYGAFVLDPDGNNIEAVHHGAV